MENYIGQTGNVQIIQVYCSKLYFKIISINGTYYAPLNLYMSTFILRNKPLFTMRLRQNWIYSVKSWPVYFTITNEGVLVPLNFTLPFTVYCVTYLKNHIKRNKRT